MCIKTSGVGGRGIMKSSLFTCVPMDQELFEFARLGKASELKRIKKLKPNSLKGCTPKGNTALHIASRLGRTSFADAISELCPSLLLEQNSRGDTALHAAARAGHSTVVRKLIDRAEKKGLKGQMMRKVNMEHNTALHEAARNRDYGSVKLLIAEDSKLASVRNKAGASALYVAAEDGCLESVASILNVMKESQKAYWGGPQDRTPLHAAVIRQHFGITKLLIEARPGFLLAKDSYGNSSLHYAVALGDLGMVRMLLNENKSIAYDGDKHNRSPFHVAASNGHTRVMEELLRQCPDSAETMDDNMWNALHLAVDMGNLEAVRYILGSNRLKELINEPDKEGNTPLHLAIIKHHFPISLLLIRDKRVDLNVINCEGKTATDIIESDQQLSKKFQKILICKALTQMGGKRSARRTNKGYRDPRIESYKGISTSISTVAGLIITTSFAATFTISNGYNGDGSNKVKSTLSKEPLMWLFIITNSLALFSSICVALLLFFAGIGDDDLLVAAISISLKLMAISLISLALTFLLGLSLVLSKWHAVVVALICIGVLCLALHWLCSWFPLLSLYFKFSFPNNLFSFAYRRSCFNQSSANQHSHSTIRMENGLTNQSTNIENESTQESHIWHSHLDDEARSSSFLSRLVGVTRFGRS